MVIANHRHHRIMGILVLMVVIVIGGGRVAEGAMVVVGDGSVRWLLWLVVCVGCAAVCVGCAAE